MRALKVVTFVFVVLSFLAVMVWAARADYQSACESYHTCTGSR